MKKIGSWLEILKLAIDEVGNTDTGKDGMGNWECFLEPR
jgi:hypothetical protein